MPAKSCGNLVGLLKLSLDLVWFPSGLRCNRISLNNFGFEGVPAGRRWDGGRLAGENLRRALRRTGPGRGLTETGGVCQMWAATIDTWVVKLLNPIVRVLGALLYTELILKVCLKDWGTEF
jgi:hypothetical protein